VRTVRGTEGIIDVEVAQFGKLCGETGVVRLFFGVKAQIFQQQDIARLCRPHRRFRFFLDTRGYELHRSAEVFREHGRDGFQAERRIHLPLWATEMEISTTTAPASSRKRIVGIAAVIRVVSPTTPTLTGTLKSTRTSARFPSGQRAEYREPSAY
jgi:hypothetical protein